MSTRLEIDTFAGREGETFRLHFDDRAVPAELIEAKATGAAAARTRQPFALLFRVPAEVVPPQRIYRLDHDDLGSLELFLVPIGPDANGMRLEAVFT